MSDTASDLQNIFEVLQSFVTNFSNPKAVEPLESYACVSLARVVCSGARATWGMEPGMAWGLFCDL